MVKNNLLLYSNFRQWLLPHTHTRVQHARARGVAETQVYTCENNPRGALPPGVLKTNNLATLFSGYSINLASISEKSGRTRYEHFTDLRRFFVCRIGANDYFNKVTKYINKIYVFIS